MSTFDQSFAVVIGTEGGFTRDPADPGNWTGGAVGKGVLGGTKYGISAAAYPGLDIAGLTLEQAKDIYRRDYWSAVHGDDVPASIALLLFDSAVNMGVGQAVRLLQQAVGVTVDGAFGPKTLAATRAGAAQGEWLATELLARRIDAMSRSRDWPSFSLGWSRRLAALAFRAIRLQQAETAAA